MAQIDITPASNPALGLHVHVPNGTSAAAFTDPSTVAASVATAAPNSQNKQVRPFKWIGPALYVAQIANKWWNVEECETRAYSSCMLARSLLQVVPLLIACAPCAFAQLPKRVERCLPYPTLAQEIRDRQPVQPAPMRVRVHVIRIDFDPNDGIPADAQEEISAELQRNEIEPEADRPYLTDLANEIAEVGVRGALRDRGYFKATATAKLTPLQTEGADISVVVTISATPGLQYRTGDIRIESTDGIPLAISPEILRSLIPLQKGEPFRTDRVRSGLEELARAYGREGYIDATPEPDTAVDDDRQTIDLVIKIDQQVQYRVESVEFLGVNAATRERLMQSLPNPGEVFDATRLNEFFKLNRTILPPDASREDVTVERQNKQRTVRILFDLRVCPQQAN